ncbi:MAG: hypothetical protein R2687_01045 [Candidatus Nanopelagicales bacterium]
MAFDVSRKTCSDAFPEYKANRAKSPSESAGQVDLIRTVLEAMSIPAVSVDGYEADDVMATIAEEAKAAGMEVLVLTGDRDCFQLVDESCTVLYPKRGVSDLSRMDPAAVEQRYGLTPAQYRLRGTARGSVGQPSNIPGRGGEDRLLARITQFGSPGRTGDPRGSGSRQGR